MKNFKDILKEKESYTDDDWVLVQDGKTVVKYIKNPKNDKAPTSFTSSKGQEMIRISKAKKDGIVKLDKSKLIEAKDTDELVNKHPDIAKANGLPGKTKILFNKVKSGKMDLSTFQNLAWLIYNSKI